MSRSFTFLGYPRNTGMELSFHLCLEHTRTPTSLMAAGFCREFHVLSILLQQIQVSEQTVSYFPLACWTAKAPVGNGASGRKTRMVSYGLQCLQVQIADNGIRHHDFKNRTAPTCRQTAAFGRKLHPISHTLQFVLFHSVQDLFPKRSGTNLLFRKRTFPGDSCERVYVLDRPACADSVHLAPEAIDPPGYPQGDSSFGPISLFQAKSFYRLDPLHKGEFSGITDRADRE